MKMVRPNLWWMARCNIILLYLILKMGLLVHIVYSPQIHIIVLRWLLRPRHTPQPTQPSPPRSPWIVCIGSPLIQSRIITPMISSMLPDRQIYLKMMNWPLKFLIMFFHRVVGVRIPYVTMHIFQTLHKFPWTPRGTIRLHLPWIPPASTNRNSVSGSSRPATMSWGSQRLPLNSEMKGPYAFLKTQSKIPPGPEYLTLQPGGKVTDGL